MSWGFSFEQIQIKMNIINYLSQKLFNKTKSKMEKHQLLLAMTAAYAFCLSTKDTERAARIAAGTNELIDELVPAAKTVNLVDSKTPGAHIKDTEVAKKAAEQNAIQTRKETEKKTETVKPAEVKKPEPPKQEVKKEEPNEELVEVAPFHTAYVFAKGALSGKRCSVAAVRTFKAFKTEEAATAANNAYPCVDELEMIFDELWTKSCQGASNKEILEMAKSELKGFYPEMKGDNDWYSKLINPMAMSVQTIKKLFGYAAKDTKVTTTRPNEKDTELKFEFDLHIAEKKEEKPAEVKPAEIKKETAKPAEEPKKELKTVQQASKPAEVKKEAPKEVTKPAETKAVIEEDFEDLDLGSDEESSDEVRTDPPAVNAFDEFNEFEKMIFDKMMEGAKLAKAVKSDVEKKEILAENRQAIRNLIAEQFDGETWIENVDETWNPKLIKYHQALVTEVQTNRAKWDKK